MIVTTTVTSRLSYGMARNTNAPPALAKVTVRGVPWVSIVLAFVIGLNFFPPFPGWQKLGGFITSATVLSFGSGPLVLRAMRKQLPDRERTFFLRGGPVIPFLAFWSSNLIVYWSGWDRDWKLFVAILLGFVLFGVHGLTHRGATAPLDLRHGMWVLPWLAGLAVITYLGSFPEPSKAAGNLGVIDFNWGFLATFVLSAAVMWLAQHYRLPADRVAELAPDPSRAGAEQPTSRT
jgi:amino acid transporter